MRKKDSHAGFDEVRYIIGDCETGEGLNDLLSNAHVAYYLVHSLDSSKDIQEIEKRCAWNFSQAQKNLEYAVLFIYQALRQAQKNYQCI